MRKRTLKEEEEEEEEKEETVSRLIYGILIRR